MRLPVFAALFASACSSSPGGNPGGGGGLGTDLAGIDLLGLGDGGYQAPWSTHRPLPAPRQETAVAELNGKIYVIGGFNLAKTIVDTVEVYDPAADTWAAAPSFPRPVHHANAATVNGKIYVLGALEGPLFQATGDVFIFDPVRRMWGSGSAIPAGTQRGSAMVGVVGTRIYLAGGFRGGAVTDFSYYDTVADTWTPLPALPAARDHGVGAAIEGKFYAIGGRNASITAISNRVDAWDFNTNGWVTRTPMPTARGGAAASLVGGRILVAGGEGKPATTTGVFDVTELYDPVTNLWSTLTPMKTPRHGTGAATVGFTVYIPGGATTQGFGAVTTVESITP